MGQAANTVRSRDRQAVVTGSAAVSRCQLFVELERNYVQALLSLRIHSGGGSRFRWHTGLAEVGFENHGAETFESAPLYYF